MFILGNGNILIPENGVNGYLRSENTQRVSFPSGLDTLLPEDKVQFLQGLIGEWFELGSLDYDFTVHRCV